MRRNYTIHLCTALLLLCVTSCNQSSNQNIDKNVEIVEMLNTTRSLLQTAPDSAFSVLTNLITENENNLNSTLKATIYKQKGFIHQMRGEFDNAHSFYSKANQLAITANDTILISRTKTDLGAIAAMSGNIQQGIHYWQQARLVLGNHKNAHNYLPSLYVNLAGAFSAIQQTDYAKHYIQLAIDKAQQSGNIEIEATALNALGQMLYLYGDIPRAKQVLRNSFELFRNTTHTISTLTALENLIFMMLEMNQIDEVMHYVNIAEEMTQKIGIPNRSSAIFYEHQAISYMEQEKYSSALHTLRKALEVREQLGFLPHITDLHFRLATAYIGLKNYVNALFYTNKVLNITEDRIPSQMIRVYETVAYLHAVKGNIENFSQAMESARTYRDSVFTQQRLANIQELYMRFETEQVRQEILLQDEIINRKRATISLLVVIGVLGIILFVAIYYFQHKKLQYQIQIVRRHESTKKELRDETNETTPKVIEFSEDDKAILHNFQLLFEQDKIYRTQNLSVSTVADALGVNRNHLSHLINGYYQRNFNEYTNQYRIEESKDIFKQMSRGDCPNHTMQHIAEMVGFAQRATFNDVFKRIVGITPSEYKTVVKSME